MDGLVDSLRQLIDVRALIQWGGVIGVTAVVFVETGLFFGFFLPGDSLLVTAGILAAAGQLDIWWLMTLPTIAAIAGDQTGYVIGYKAGNALREKYPKFKDHLERAHAFYEKYGVKTIVIARFVPIVRTFVPAVAGAARMNYRTFVTFNIAGGAMWVLSTTLAGYGLGRALPSEIIDRYLHMIIAIVILLSISPGLYEWWKTRRSS
jgi:membrane-associated protein